MDRVASPRGFNLWVYDSLEQLFNRRGSFNGERLREREREQREQREREAERD